jgi:hypothetical protein
VSADGEQLVPADAQDAATKDTRLGTTEFSGGSPLFIRIFKQEAQLELWMQKAGRFELFDSFPICHWSGTLGPKLYEGDRQAPEGFYSVSPQQLCYPAGMPVRSISAIRTPSTGRWDAPDLTSWCMAAADRPAVLP